MIPTYTDLECGGVVVFGLDLAWLTDLGEGWEEKSGLERGSAHVLLRQGNIWDHWELNSNVGQSLGGCVSQRPL